MVRARRFAHAEPPATRSLIGSARSLARPLRSPADLGPLLERVGDARFVLIGEASHGTHEYYDWRAELSRRLIDEKGFSFVAVEGDWPDCYRLNRFVRALPDGGHSAREVLLGYERWPTWMWANEDVVAFADWLRERNQDTAEEKRAGFYGLDVYSLWSSLREVAGYLRRREPSALPSARRAFRCFEPYGEDEQEYARATAWVPATCEDEVVNLLKEMHARAPRYQADGREAHFDAEQNALVVKNAEAYYRVMIRNGPWSWNVRDRHMALTLDRLMAHHGPQAKAIVWEHNTHVGDARFTDMAEDGMVNVGQLVRESHGGEGVVLVGFGSYAGSVVASTEWGEPWQDMTVPPAREDSWEDVLHRAGGDDKLLIFADAGGEWLAPRGHRAVGVVYHPGYDHFGNYVPTVLPRRYDAFLYIDSTEALRPLHAPTTEEAGEVPETYPSGV
jgi:erythromycin esterase-like protein